MTTATRPSLRQRIVPWLTGRWHPWRIAWTVLALAAVAVAGTQGYAWYHLHAGGDALARYQTDSARSHLQQCLTIWPHSTTALLLLARAERRAGMLDEAQEHLDQCRQQSGPEPGDDVAFEWALLRATLGDLATVEEGLQARLLKRPAQAPLIWEALAEGYRRTCRVRDARATLDNWLRLDPNNAHAHYLRGEVHRTVGAISRARDDYQRVVELDPGNDQARRILVRALVQLGHYEDAAGHIEMLRPKYPDDAELETLHARCDHDLGRRAEAVARLDALLQAQPDYGPALRERGRFLLAAGDFSGAAPWLRQAAQVLPYDYECHWALQHALQGMGRTDEAQKERAYAQKLKDRLERINYIQSREMTDKPFDAAVQCELGGLFLEIGHTDDAERWLHSALRLQPNLAAAHAALAELYEQRGDSAKAQQHRRAAAR